MTTVLAAALVAIWLTVLAVFIHYRIRSNDRDQ